MKKLVPIAFTVASHELARSLRHDIPPLFAIWLPMRIKFNSSLHLLPVWVIRVFNVHRLFLILDGCVKITTLSVSGGKSANETRNFVFCEFKRPSPESDHFFC